MDYLISFSLLRFLEKYIEQIPAIIAITEANILNSQSSCSCQAPIAAINEVESELTSPIINLMLLIVCIYLEVL
tara:strand:+ start:292 stop:513 length:222 start_codon:yes stop_codon:yes gene_type:complete